MDSGTYFLFMQAHYSMSFLNASVELPIYRTFNQFVSAILLIPVLWDVAPVLISLSLLCDHES